jgi:hypothetical protein
MFSVRMLQKIPTKTQCEPPVDLLGVHEPAAWELVDPRVDRARVRLDLTVLKNTRRVLPLANENQTVKYAELRYQSH